MELEKERKRQPLKNNFKDQIDLDDTAHDSQQLHLDLSTNAKMAEQDAFQNFVAQPPNKMLSKHKLFANVFSVYKQAQKSQVE